MKPYGQRPHDSRTCRYGCCGANKSSATNRRAVDKKRVDRAARKRARRITMED